MQPDMSDLFADPSHYFFAFEGEHALFAEMNRAAYARSIFLDRRIAALSPNLLRYRVADLINHGASLTPQVPRLNWIFHVAHCGSTLLANALERGNANLILREPRPLRQLAISSAAQGGMTAQPLLALATRLLDRRFNEHQAVIVKANVPVNFIMPQIMQLNPQAPALFLYHRLEDYLFAILRSPGHRTWVERVTADLAPLIEPWVGSLSLLDAPKRGAALWLAQISLYHAAIERYPNARSLDAEHLFADTVEVLAATAQHFGSALSPEELKTFAESKTLSRYSKDESTDFDNGQRLARRDALKAEIGADVSGAIDWILKRGSASSLPVSLGKPLFGNASPLL